MPGEPFDVFDERLLVYLGDNGQFEKGVLGGRARILAASCEEQWQKTKG